MSSIFLFHRDFRTIDNTSLIALSQLSKNIIPIFIFNPDQIDPSKNPYYNKKSVQFMIDCLRGIPHLQLFYGDTVDVLESLFKKNKITHLGFNLDYTFYAKERTKKVIKLATQYHVNIVAKEDYTLLNLHEYRDESFYKVFKPFYEHLLQQKIPKPDKINIKLSDHKLKIDSKFIVGTLKPNTSERKSALDILSSKLKFKDYDKTRNFPIIETTHLSKYIKFGTVSIREVYDTLKKNEELARQVIWHDFYACLMYFLPYEDTLGGGNLQHKKLKWRDSTKDFNAWCNGQTGIPLIDAGMRQLNETGWMHNRVRLIVSNFLSLVLKIDWRKGEKYFAQKPDFCDHN